MTAAPFALAFQLVAAAGAAPPAWQPPALPAPAQCAPKGDLAARLDRALARLKQPPFTQPFILSDVSFAEKRIFTEYSGDISGRILGVSGTELLCGRAPTWAPADLIRELPKYQNADGHFGRPQDLAKGVDGNRDMPILWGNGRILIGLLEVYQATKDPQALEIARKLGDYYVNSDALLDKPELVDRFGTYAAGYATCYFSGLEGLVALSRATGDKRYLTQAERMADLMARTFRLSETKDQRLHSHGRLCAHRGLLDLYEATGDRQYLDLVEQELRIFATRYLLPTGGITEQTTRSDPRDEGCTEADWLRNNFRLWRLTGDDSYLDLAEAMLVNELAVNQFPNGGFGHHNAILTGGRFDGYIAPGGNGNAEAYWCCSEHGPRALLEVARNAVAVCGSDVFVNLYEPVEVNLAVAGTPVRLAIEPQPEGQHAAVAVHCDKPVRFALHLRTPAWCPHQPAARGSRTSAIRWDANGRQVVTKLWPRDSKYFVSLPLRLAYCTEEEPLRRHFLDAGGVAPADAVSLYLGPYLLGRAAPDSEKGAPPEFSVAAAKVDAAKLTVTAGAVTYRPVSRLAADGSGFRVRVNVRP